MSFARCLAGGPLLICGHPIPIDRSDSDTDRPITDFGRPTRPNRIRCLAGGPLLICGHPIPIDRSDSDTNRSITDFGCNTFEVGRPIGRTGRPFFWRLAIVARDVCAVFSRVGLNVDGLLTGCDDERRWHDREREHKPGE
jgi:hypothetical protein